MAYYSQERKKTIQPGIKALLAEYGLKGSLSVKNHSTVQLNIKSGDIDFIGSRNEIIRANNEGRTEHDYGYQNEITRGYMQLHFNSKDDFTGKAQEFIAKAFALLNEENFDKSDSQSDYFHVGWYSYIYIGDWEAPYIHTEQALGIQVELEEIFKAGPVSIKSLVATIKENEQDFEFYPTTKQMVETIYNQLVDDDSHSKILDIGCGNGNFFNKFEEITKERKALYGEESRGKLAYISEKYAIEKSEILINNLPNDVIIVGTDFQENTLLDKKVDVIFCNPPYSQYESWACKIINEAYCNYIYLVVPQRWQDSEEIKGALNAREFKSKIIGSFDFLDAERAARAKVDIVKIYKPSDSYRREAADPFNIWFDNEFKINIPNDETSSYEKSRTEREKLNETARQQVVEGRDYVQVLCSLYQNEMAGLLNSYKTISTLDGALLKELGVTLANVKKGLQEKIAGVKYKYWHEFFDNLDKINRKLTSSKRKMMLEKLHDSVHVDFTESNAYAIVIWVIKNANNYFDEQLKEMYLRLTEPEYIKNYKSNQKTWQKDGWRYKKEDHSHYALDYRIVTEDYRGHRYSWEKQDTSDSALIKDIRTIANNLGFDYFGEYKSFKNNNVHFKFEIQFMKAFNIEAARLFGWVRNASDVVNEFPDITTEEARKYFKSNFLITSEPKQLLLNAA